MIFIYHGITGGGWSAAGKGDPESRNKRTSGIQAEIKRSLIKEIDQIWQEEETKSALTILNSTAAWMKK